jgi:hypothetical protein
MPYLVKFVAYTRNLPVKVHHEHAATAVRMIKACDDSLREPIWESLRKRLACFHLLTIAPPRNDVEPTGAHTTLLKAVRGLQHL